ncbi:hypothetical protein ADILRU_1358 [Leifsonia rubra CMS 76R]|nr:hypothetical protein ADILRU_1358 [Leifsonia rubra CMS 76R]
MLHIMTPTLISIIEPASHFIKNGVANGANKVDMAVIVIDSARLALAR